MKTVIRPFQEADVRAMRAIWNEVVEAANAFPQETGLLSNREALEFFSSQTYTGVGEVDGKVLGLFILHPNNIGRCSSIANASYAVAKEARGKGLGKRLVEDSLLKAKESGFHVLQFNAVVASNVPAIHLYENLGFERLGQIPKCFRQKDGSFEDLLLFFHRL